jgi:hypothetical protein
MSDDLHILLTLVIPFYFCHSERSEESAVLALIRDPMQIPRFARDDNFFQGSAETEQPHLRRHLVRR